MTQATTVADERPRTSRRRRVLAGIALVLACLTILLTTLAVWTHQVALNTNRFTALVGERRHRTGCHGSDRDADQHPGRRRARRTGAARGLDSRTPSSRWRVRLTASVTERIDQRLQVALQNPRLQEALRRDDRASPTPRSCGCLRGETEALSIVDGYLTLDVFPVVGAALTELQSMGLIPADVQLPDLTSPDAPDVLAQRLETSLGVTLPADFGTIRLMPAERLTTARTIVRAFDLIVILLVDPQRAAGRACALAGRATGGGCSSISASA